MSRDLYLRRADGRALVAEMLERLRAEIRSRLVERAPYFAALREREGEDAFAAAWSAEVDRLHGDLVAELRERLDQLSFEGMA